MSQQSGLKSDQRPDLSVIVVNYNTGHLLERMFSALDAARGVLRLQIIVVDNASCDDSVAILRAKYPDVELIANRTNIGFGRANNQAVPFARGRYVLLLNTDAFVSPDTLTKTICFMDESPQCGILGVKLIGENGELQPCCRYFHTPWNLFLNKTGLNRIFTSVRLVDDMNWDHASVRNCDWVPGCYYLVRREVIEQVKLFDPRFFLYFEEVDHSRAARKAGWTVTFFPFTSVVHIGGQSAMSLTGPGQQISALQVESELLYFRKHFGVSGLLNAVFLTACSDLYIAAKGMLRRSKNEILRAMKHLLLYFKILSKTRFASRPTR